MQSTVLNESYEVRRIMKEQYRSENGPLWHPHSSSDRVEVKLLQYIADILTSSL